jgi:hypothetical protein
LSGADRVVRSAVLDLLVNDSAGPTASQISATTGLEVVEVNTALQRLADAHRLVLAPEGGRVMMAHPFSGFPTDYQSRIGDRAWWANCGWDAFAILALLGDGTVVATTADGSEATWTVDDGVVAPGGLVHFVVPPRRFWDDIGFT